jgi:CRISPR system Cascade subunit CasA
LLVERSALRTTAVDAAADAEAAVRVLRHLATNLVRAAGGSDGGSGEADRAAERGYALLDRAFRDWLAARLGPDSDPVAERVWWQRFVWQAVKRLGDELVAAAGPAAWVGRTGVDRAGRELHYSSSQAEVWFRARLAKALPMAADISDQKQPAEQKQEVPA